MGKSSSHNNLQKIHTYAQDIEAVRSAGQPNVPPAPAKIAPTPSPKATDKKLPTPPEVKTKSTPTTKHTDLLVPPKPKLPAIRTMADDSKKIAQATKALPTPTVSPSKTHSPVALETDNKETPLKAEAENPEVKEKISYTKTPTIRIETPASVEDKKTTPIDNEAKVSNLPTKAISKLATVINLPEQKTIAQSNKTTAKVGANKQTRDTTYSATVITDTKHKRFSLWRELKNKLGALIKTKSAKKKVSYTAPTTPLRKGVVQSATTNTARKTIADYSSLKNRVKARKSEEEAGIDGEVDTTAENYPLQNKEEIEKTRFELLTSIEKEVGQIDDELPKYLSPINHPGPDSPIFNRPKSEIVSAKKPGDDSTWDHYTETDNEQTTSTTAQYVAPASVPVVALPHQKETMIHVPDPVHQIVAEAPVIPQPATPRILPTIPPMQAEIPDVDMTAPAEAYTPAELEINTISERPETVEAIETSYVPEEAVAEEDVSYQNEPLEPLSEEPQTLETPYFTQPKIEPIIPTWSTATPEAYQQPTAEVYEEPSNFNEPKETPVGDDASPALSARAIPLADMMIPIPSAPRSSSPVPPPVPRRSNGIIRFITQYTQTFILGGLVIASVVIVGTLAVTSLLSQFSDKPATTTSHNYFNSSALYPVVVQPLSALTISEQIVRHNNAIGVSEIILQSNESIPVSPIILSELLKLPLDPSFNASLLDLRFGWYREEPFLVISYSGDTVARGALLQWERTIYSDLLPLFGQTPVAPSMLAVFKDATVNNIDVRVLYTSSGEQELMYGIVASGHLIITTNEMSFLNLSSNFNAQ